MPSAATSVPVAKKDVLLIDLSALFWSSWHATGDKEISAASQNTMSAVRRCIGSGDRLVAICCDSGRSFRKDLLPSYKAQRPEKDHASIGELDRVKDKLSSDGFLLWEAPGFEADDVIATAATAAWGRGHDVVIASGDKDLLQLVGEGIRCLRTHTWTEVGTDDVVAKFGVRPMQLGDWLALVGDASDNIKGAPGVGPKTATALLAKYETLGALYEALGSDPTSVSTPAVVKSLRDNEAAVGLARKIVALRTDAPIDFDDIYRERKPARISTEETTDMDESDAEYEDEAISPLPPRAVALHEENAKRVAEPEHATSTVAISTQQTAPPQSFERALEPTSIGNAYKLAKGLFESRLYQRFQNPEAIMAVIMRGREVGLGALTALDCWHVIEGKPAPHAWLIIGRAKSDPDCEYFQCIERSDTSCTWETKNRRNPKSTRLTYTLEQARRAGLIKPGGNWDKRAPEMICKTAGVQLARVEYPASAMGLYSIDELGGDE